MFVVVDVVDVVIVDHAEVNDGRVVGISGGVIIVAVNDISFVFKCSKIIKETEQKNQ